MIDLETATLSDFQDFVGTSFNISEGDSVLSLKLSEATKMGSGSREGGAFFSGFRRLERYGAATGYIQVTAE